MAFMKDGKKQSVGNWLAKGFLTGFIEAIVCYPTEFVKTQLQLDSKSKPQYKGILDCARQNVKQNGALSLYRGAAPLIFGSSVKQMARWTGYAKMSGMLRDSEGHLALHHNMFAGFCAGASEAVVAVTPIETLKTRATDDLKRGTGKYRNSVDAAVKIVRAEGPMGLYMGVVPTIAKQGTNQMVRFPIQQFYHTMLFGDDKKKAASPLLNGLSGAMAGGTSVLLTMPQDTIKTRMQGEQAKKLYKGTLDCATQILRKEGILFFWTGTWPRFVRVTLDVGLSFAIFPLLNKFF